MWFPHSLCLLVASTSRCPPCADRLESSCDRAVFVNWLEDTFMYCKDWHCFIWSNTDGPVSGTGWFLSSNSTSMSVFIWCRMLLITVPCNLQLSMFSTLILGNPVSACTSLSPALDRSWPATSSPCRRGELTGSWYSTPSISSTPRPERASPSHLSCGSLVRRSFSTSPWPPRLSPYRQRTRMWGEVMEDRTSLHPLLRLVSRIYIFINLVRFLMDTVRWCDKSLFLSVLSITLTIINLVQLIHSDIKSNSSWQHSPTLTFSIPIPLTSWGLTLLAVSLHLLGVSLTLPGPPSSFFFIPSQPSSNSTTRSRSVQACNNK